MSNNVCLGACLKCSFGAVPSVLTAAPINRKLIANMPAANIMDNKPLVNILPFGTCTSLANPLVASATAAAAGVLTPMPCVPATMSPWVPGAPRTMINGMPALTNSSKLFCMYGGVIEVTMPGQMTVETK